MKNRGDAADGEWLRVATEMRRAAEPVDARTADYTYSIYTTRYRRGTQSADGVVGAPSRTELLATYDWVAPMSPSANRSPELTTFVHGMLQEAAGQPATALATLRALRERPSLPDTIRADVDVTIKRLSR